jgi:glutamate-1-semialdehyde 2,1-aminomutase
MRNISKSKELFAESSDLFPGGVNSPVRAFKSVGGDPLFIAKASGARVTDADGNSYIDYVLSWGPMILGHSHPEVVAALGAALPNGFAYGAPGALESRLAHLIRGSFASMEMLRFVNSGTEATMSALRVARAFTGRSKIIKFGGCYHGHADLLLAQAGSGVATLGLPDSPGVPAATVSDTLVAPFNDFAAVQRFFASFPNEIAAVIVEPVAGNMGVVPPAEGFLAALRAITEEHGSLLIFDEVMTGFRVHRHGAQSLYGITPDLTTLGKVIGGGLPVGAYGGRRDAMSMIAPSGSVYQAGTFSGNPLTMTAGIATMEILARPGVWDGIERSAATLDVRLNDIAKEMKIPVQVQRVGTMMTLFFNQTPVTSWETARTSDTKRFARVFQRLLDSGVYWVPSQYESAFFSTAHGAAEIEITANAFRGALAAERSSAS